MTLQRWGNEFGVAGTKSTDYTVNSQDFASLSAALEHLQNFSYVDGAKPILQLTAGSHTFLSSRQLDGITLKGVTLDLTMASVQSTSGTAGAWTVVINVTESVAGVAVGDYLGLGGLTGGVHPLLLSGAFPVTAVDTVNKRLTFVLNSKYTAAAPSGAITGTFTVFKTKLNLPIFNHTLYLDGVAAISLVAYGAYVETISPCVFFNQAYIQFNSSLAAYFSYWGGAEGVYAGYNCFVTVENSYLGNGSNAEALIIAEKGSVVIATTCAIIGCAIGVLARYMAMVSTYSATIGYNTLGLKAEQMSLINTATAVFTTNTTDKSPATFDVAGNVGAIISNTTP